MFGVFFFVLGGIVTAGVMFELAVFFVEVVNDISEEQEHRLISQRFNPCDTTCICKYSVSDGYSNDPYTGDCNWDNEDAVLSSSCKWSKHAPEHEIECWLTCKLMREDGDHACDLCEGFDGCAIDCRVEEIEDNKNDDGNPKPHVFLMKVTGPHAEQIPDSSCSYCKKNRVPAIVFKMGNCQKPDGDEGYAVEGDIEVFHNDVIE